MSKTKRRRQQQSRAQFAGGPYVMSNEVINREEIVGKLKAIHLNDVDVTRYIREVNFKGRAG